MNAESLYRVLRTSGRISAPRRKSSRYPTLIETNGCRKNSRGETHCPRLPALSQARAMHRSKSAASCVDVAPRACGKTRITTISPGPKLSILILTMCRSCLYKRCRTTEFPTLLGMMKPTFTGRRSALFSSRSLSMAMSKREDPPRVPLKARENSAEFRIRFSAGSKTQADSEARPLRRRAETTARPARVLIRLRKPCTLARRRLFG